MFPSCLNILKFWKLFKICEKHDRYWHWGISIQEIFNESYWVMRYEYETQMKNVIKNGWCKYPRDRTLKSIKSTYFEIKVSKFEMKYLVFIWHMIYMSAFIKFG